MNRLRRARCPEETQVDVLLTLAEAAAEFDPPMSVDQLAGLVHVTGLRPKGFRRTGVAGRPARTYPAGKLYLLHAAMAPLIAEFSREPG